MRQGLWPYNVNVHYLQLNMVSVETIFEAFHEFLNVETNRLLCAFLAGILVTLCMGLLVSMSRRFSSIICLSTNSIRQKAENLLSGILANVP